MMNNYNDILNAEHAHSVQKQSDRDQALADAFASHKDMQLSGSGEDLTNFRLYYDAEINNGEGGYNLIADRTTAPLIKDMSVSVLSDDISFDTFKNFLSSHNLAFESVIDTIVPEKQATEETKTTSQKVKAAIKAAGIPTKRISVTTSHPGYEEVIRVTIKDTNINIDDVEKIARRFREVAIDERCQEILQGGNTFVKVRYDYNALDRAVKALEPLAADTIKRINTTPANSYKIIAPNGFIMELLTFTNSDHWTIYNTKYSFNDIDHRASVRPSDYYPENLPHALARIFFNLGARWVDQIPDPESTPEPDNNFYYIVNARARSFSGYAVELTAPDYTTAAAYAEGAAESAIEDGNPDPVYYVVTRSAVLARVDNKGIHAPKGNPQRTPSKVLNALDAYDLHKAG